MFSARTHWDPTPNPIAEAVERRLARGLPLLDLTESNPTRVGLGFPQAALLEAFADPAAAAYLPHPFGLPSTREAIAAYYGERGLAVSPERIVVTSSTSEAYAYLFKLLTDPGDEVLVPQPSYPLFEYLAGLESIRTVGYPLRYDGEWHLDRQALREATGAKARAVIVVSPNNPTGSYLKTDELAFLAAFCAERGLALLCDEVFSDFPLEVTADRSPGVICQSEALAFSLGGLSKLAAAPQVKIGWLAASGPEKLVESALRRLEIIADSYLSPSTPSQLAAPKILARRASIQSPLLARARQNLGALRSLHRPTSPWQPLRAEGGWTAVLRTPQSADEQALVIRLVEEDGVLVHPGFFFDFPSAGHLAASLIVEPEKFREALARVAIRLDELA